MKKTRKKAKTLRKPRGAEVTGGVDKERCYNARRVGFAPCAPVDKKSLKKK